jgi:hypothetical protein
MNGEILRNGMTTIIEVPAKEASPLRQYRGNCKPVAEDEKTIIGRTSSEQD